MRRNVPPQVTDVLATSRYEVRVIHSGIRTESFIAKDGWTYRQGDNMMRPRQHTHQKLFLYHTCTLGSVENALLASNSGAVFDTSSSA